MPSRVHSSALPLLVVALVLSSREIPAQDQNDELPVIHGPAPPVPPDVVSRDDNGRVTLRATRIAEPIVLDGKLDESVYARIAAVSDFIQQEPREGEPATEKTEAWVFFDDENVYVSARCWDSHPERMIINEMRRDNFNIFQNENVTLVFDTFYDRRNGFFFQTNPLGALRDQAVGDEGQTNNQDWNTVWDVKASVFDQGWMVEIAIPFKSLRYREGRDQVWSFNLRRSIRWKNEEAYLSPVAASHRFRGIYKFSEAATLVGIEAPYGSRSLEVKPYGITSVVTNRTAEPPRVNDFDGMIGVLLDARKGEIYIALFRRSAAALARLTADSVLPIQSAIKLLQSSRDDRFAPLLLIGDGAQSYERQLRAALGHSVAISNGARYTSVAAQVAMLAIPRLAAASGDDIGRLTPVTTSTFSWPRNVEAMLVGVPPNISVRIRTPSGVRTRSSALRIIVDAVSTSSCHPRDTAATP